MSEIRSLRLDRLTVENWRTSARLRHSGGTWVAIWIEELPNGRYRTVYGTPGFEAAREFDTLAAALEHANVDGDGVRIELVDNLAIADAPNRSFGRQAVEKQSNCEPLEVADEGLVRDGNVVGRGDVLASVSPLDGVNSDDSEDDTYGEQRERFGQWGGDEA